MVLFVALVDGVVFMCLLHLRLREINDSRALRTITLRSLVAVALWGVRVVGSGAIALNLYSILKTSKMPGFVAAFLAMGACTGMWMVAMQELSVPLYMLLSHKLFLYESYNLWGYSKLFGLCSVVCTLVGLVRRAAGEHAKGPTEEADPSLS